MWACTANSLGPQRLRSRVRMKASTSVGVTSSAPACQMKRWAESLQLEWTSEAALRALRSNSEWSRARKDKMACKSSSGSLWIIAGSLSISVVL